MVEGVGVGRLDWGEEDTHPSFNAMRDSLIRAEKQHFHQAQITNFRGSAEGTSKFLWGILYLLLSGRVF